MLLYDVISETHVVALCVYIKQAKSILRAYYEIYSPKPNFSAEMRGWKVWVSRCGGEPFVICRIKRSHPVKI